MNHYDEICPGMEVAREEVLSLMLRAWIQRGDIHSGFEKTINVFEGS